MMKFLILYYYLTTKFLKFINSKALNSWVMDYRLKSLVKMLSYQSPFYKKLGTRDFVKWPIMNKKTMMDNLDELNTKQIKKAHAFQVAMDAEKNRSLSSEINGITIGLSSGTSNVRGLSMASSWEKAAWSGIVLGKCLPYAIIKKQKIALFLRADSDIYNTITSKTITFKYFSLSGDSQKNIHELGLFNPDVLVSPPSMLRLIAEAQANKTIRLSTPKIISAAEVLDPIDQRYIEGIFQQKLHQIYQCTEGFLASTCEFGTLHLNEDFVKFDKKFIADKKFIPIITDTLRSTQPIVKFEHNDILTLKDNPCACKSVHTSLAYIEGRTDDIFKFYHKDTGELIQVLPFAISHLMNLTLTRSLTSFSEFKIVQQSMDIISIALLGPHIEEDFKICKQVLEDFLTLQNCNIPTIQLKPYVKSELFIKLKRVESIVQL